MEIASNGAIILLVLVVSALLIVTGLKKQPGIGVIGAVIIISITLWLRRDPITSLGFGSPPSWGATIFLGLVLGILIQLLSVALIEPLSEMVTNTPHDHSLVAGVKGNWKAFIQWILIVWFFVALLEKGLYRGFLMTEISKIMGDSSGALVFNILFTSVVFGLSHGYQGRSGTLSTGIVGVVLGLIFVLSKYNLWLAIFTHGFIDTVGIGLIAIDGDKYLRRVLLKKQK